MQAEITIVNDDSVERAIKKVADKLDNKYNKKRKINENLLKEKTGYKKVFSIMLNIVFVCIIAISSMLCLSSIVCRVNGTASSFAGFSLMRISSGSMVASGFEVGDNAVVKAVDTSTLREGDIIAFYVYSDSYSEFDSENATKLDLEDTKTKSHITIGNFFGFQSNEIKEAANAGSMIIFHEIVGIYEDSNGERWFETKGSSNLGADIWKTNESMVVGVYDDSAFARGVAVVLNGLTGSVPLVLLIIIPFAIFTFLLVSSFIKDIQKAKLELDVVEEKRKLTDEICVKYGVGYSMDTKTKYKVLAQANDDEKKEYLSLLWKDGKAPNSIKKYVIKKQIYLSGMKKLLDLNRECEKRFKDKENPNEIAKYYMEEKKKIQAEQVERERKIKNLRKGRA